MPQKKTVSILGDSISTLVGYTSADDAYYDPVFASATGIASAEDTWWMKVIFGLDAQLLVNDSHSGSSVCRGGYQAASTPWRIAKLKKNGQHPDYILVFSGLNDVAFSRTAEEFQAHYTAMLQEMLAQYPHAEIVCGTLCKGYVNSPGATLFINLEHCLPLSLYNDAIRHAVKEYGCQLADLASFQQDYSSIDGVHPNKTGMEQLAQMWLRCLPL